MIAASPLSGCPLAKPATQILRWPSEGKGATIGRQSGSSCVNGGVSSWCTDPPVTKAHHRNDTNPRRNAKGSYPHPPPPNPPRPSGVTNVGPTAAIDAHNVAGTIVPKRVAHQVTPSDETRKGAATDRKSTRLNSSHVGKSRMPSSA